MPAKKLKTGSTQQANVADKATEQTKKPTIKSLQQEVANLTEQLIYANQLCISQEKDILNIKNDLSELERENVLLKASLNNRDSVIEELQTPWYRKVFKLFGN